MTRSTRQFAITLTVLHDEAKYNDFDIYLEAHPNQKSLHNNHFFVNPINSGRKLCGAARYVQTSRPANQQRNRLMLKMDAEVVDRIAGVRPSSGRRRLSASFGALIVLAFLSSDAHAAPEAWCTANPANCVCSDTLQSTSYTQVANYGNGGAWLGDQTGNKPCHYEGKDISIQATFGSSSFSGALAISTDPTILGLLPNRNPVSVARFLRHSGSSNSSQNSTYRTGYDPVPLGSTTKRIALRWYAYYSPTFNVAYDGSGCTNGKIAHSSATGFSAPYVTMQWYNNSTNAYSFVNNAGWTWAGKSSFDGFVGGHAPRQASGVNFQSKRGKWLRFEIIVRRPRLADSTSLGTDWELWITDVTAGTPPVQDMRFSAGCTSCINVNGVPGSNFSWDASIHALADMVALHTEWYRAGPCDGFQGWMYVAVAKWDTDAGQMIGPAVEVEGGGGSSDTTPPTAPSSLAATSASSTQINLTWTAATDSVGVTAYRVERCQGASCTTFNEIGTSASTTYNSSGLAASTTYRYRTRAQDAAGNLGPYSNIAQATTAPPPPPDTTPPTAPLNLGAAAINSSQINLAWTAATDNVGVTAYRVERCQGSACTTFAEIGTSTITSYSNASLADSTTYRYRVRAQDAAGNLGPYSNISQIATPAPPPPGAALAGAWALNEGTGTQTADLSGNGNVGTLSGNTSWLPSAQHGAGLSFDGSGDSVQMASSTSLNVGGTELTVSFWAWVDDSTGSDQVFLSKPWNAGSQGSPPYQYAVEYNTQSNSAGFFFGTTSGAGSGPYFVSLTPGTWTYVTFTYDGSFVRGYRDGTLILTTAATGSIGQRTTTLRLGVDSIGNQGFKGRLDDVRVYARALSPSEIVSDMATDVASGLDTTPPNSVTALRRTDAH